MLDMLSELFQDHAKPMIAVSVVVLFIGVVGGVHCTLWVVKQLAARALRVQQTLHALSRKYNEKDQEDPET